MAFVGLTEAGQPIVIDSTEATLRLQQGASIRVSGQGFFPGTVVTVWIFSEPRRLGQVLVRADGTYDATIDVPADLPPGRHTLQANGVDGRIVERSVSLGIVVDAPSGSPATQISAFAGQAQTAVPGAAVTVPPAVVVRDAQGHGVAGVSVIFAVTGGGGLVTGATVTTDGQGIAAVGGWSLGPVPGLNTLTATVAGLTGSPVTFTATAVVDRPPVPTHLRVSPRDRSLVVRWQAPSDAPTASPTRFVVQYRSQPDGAWTDGAELGATTRETTLLGLRNGVAYEVRVAAQNAGGRSGWTPVQVQSPYRIELRAADATPLHAFATLVAMQWVYDGAGTPAFIMDSTDAFGVRASWPVGPLTLFRLAATPGRYVARVTVADDTAFENPSNEVTVVAAAEGLPATPTNVRVVVEGNRVTVTWMPNFTAAIPTQTYLLVSGIAEPIPLGTGGAAVFADVPAATYEVRLAAGNAVGISPPTDPLTITVPGACVLPGTPAWVSVGLERGVGLLTWETAASGGAPTDYLVQVEGMGTFRTGGTRRISGPLPSGEYRIRVLAENACGVSAPSALQVLRVP
jgi:hypothetical protein